MDGKLSESHGGKCVLAVIDRIDVWVGYGAIRRSQYDNVMNLGTDAFGHFVP